MDVGYIYNKNYGCIDDVITVRMVGVESVVAFSCKLDEAVVLAAGLNKVAGMMMVGQLPIPKDMVDFISDCNKEKQD